MGHAKSLLVEGDGPGETERGRIYLTNGIRAYNTGEILVGAYGRLENDTHLENNGGVLRVTEDTGVLYNGGTMEFLGTPGSLVISQGNDSWNNGLSLRGCRVEVDSAGWLYARSCPVLLDGGTTLENQGEIELFGWEWQAVELAGTVENRGRLVLPKHTALSGTLTNYEYLSIQDSGSVPFRVSGTLDNRGVIAADSGWDAGIQLADGGSAPGVPEELFEQ